MHRRVLLLIAMGTFSLVGCGLVGFQIGIGPDDVSGSRDAGVPERPDAGAAFCVEPQVHDPMLRAATCEAGEWCRMLDPEGFAGAGMWESIAVAADDDVWAKGYRWTPVRDHQRSVLAHWDGHSWKDSLELPELYGDAVLWAGPGSKLWLVTPRQAAASWDGTSLTEYKIDAHPLDPMVWGSSDSDVWAVGTNGLIVHWDGTSWTSRASGKSSLWSLWGADATHLWMGGDRFVLFWDGSTLTEQKGPSSTSEFSRLSGTSATDVWAIDFRSGLLRFDGTQWEREETPRASAGFLMSELWARGPEDVWVADWSGFRRWNRSSWSPQSCGFQPALKSLQGRVSGDLWALGAGGSVIRVDGDDLRPRDFLANHPWAQIGGSGPSDVWIADSWVGYRDGAVATLKGWGQPQRALLHWDGDKWSTHSMETLDPVVDEVRSNGPNDAWAITKNALWHWDGTSWTAKDDIELLKNRKLSGLWSNGTDDLWVVADDVVMHGRGAEWTAMPVGPRFSVQHVRGTGPDDVWAWSDGVLVRWNGTKWTDQSKALDRTYGRVTGVLPGSDGQVWIYSENQFAHWDGSSWTGLPPITSGGRVFIIQSGALLGSNEPWALGWTQDMANVVVRWDGTQWVDVVDGLGTGKWNTLWAASPTESWAIGDANNVYRLRQ